MQHDELIWQLIGHGHCSFKSQVGSERAFCRNEYNVNGLCCRSACPLANSRYATVREHEGRTFLYMKTIERAHSPLNLWEKVPLPKNYASALEVIDEQLAHWPNYLIHKNKQRLTKIVQYLIRMSKIKQSTVHTVLEPYSNKEERKDAKNEDKALRAARVEVSIEKELLSRLKQVSKLFSFIFLQIIVYCIRFCVY
jgi:protein MAK16